MLDESTVLYQFLVKRKNYDRFDENIDDQIQSCGSDNSKDCGL